MLMIVLQMMLGCNSTTDGVPTALAQSGRFDVILSVPGNLEAVEETAIVAPSFSGRPEITWIADQGAFVEKGDRIVEFDRVDLQKALENAENELDLALTKIVQNKAKLELALEDAEAGITRAELDLHLATMRRTDSDTVPLVDREDARVSQTKSEMAIDAAKASLSSVKLESRADTQLLQLEVDRKQRLVEELKDQLTKTVINAPTDGLILLKTSWDGELWKVGSKPWDGVALAALPDLSEMKVVCEVHEVDSPRVAVDQHATVVLEAFPDQTVEGYVKKVADLAIPKGDDEIKYLDIDVALEKSTPEMKPGLSARVELVLDTVHDAIWIPIEAVNKTEEGATVWVSGLTGWSEVAVELGVENDTHVVITSGIAAGDTVALSNPNSDEPVAAASL